MTSESKLPGFSGAVSSEESILYDNYCYKDILSFDLAFKTPNINFAVDGGLKASTFKTGCSVDLNHSGFSSTFAFNNKKPPNFTLKFPSRKFLISRFVNESLTTKTFLRPTFQIKVASAESKLKPDFIATTAIVNEILKSKLKLTSKKFVGNFTCGTGIFGFGLRGGVNLAEYSISNYSIVGWYCEGISRIKAMFNGNWKNPDENRLNGYFYYKIFENVEFVTKLTSDLKNNNSLLIGCEGKFWEKGRWKVRGCSEGKIAVGISNKVLSRTKVSVAALVNTFDLGESKFGAYFSFHAKAGNKNNIEVN